MSDPKHNLTKYLQKLYKLHAFGIKFGLEAEAGLLERLGNPERGSKKVIHVAGTNGKGSVCAMLDSILRSAGCKTGLYTSPHLVRVNERIKVNGECIPDSDLAALIELVDKCAGDYAKSHGGRQITFFEFLTALAFEYFRRHKVDVLVLETGMGGRLDATNVAIPQVSVITSIGLEHTKYLGSSLEEIAAEKGGIIKSGVPVIVGSLPEEALAVIEKMARGKNTRVIRADQAVTVRRQKQTIDGQKISIESSANSYGTIQLPLLGAHQLGNAAIAVATLEEFCRVNDIDPSSPESPVALGLRSQSYFGVGGCHREEWRSLASQGSARCPVPTSSSRDRGVLHFSLSAVKRGFASVSWPGRLQVISREPVIIIDGAHNPEAAAVLNAALKELFGGRPIYLILGMCSDKDAAGFIRNLTMPISHCWIVGLANERSLPPEQLAQYVQNKEWPFSTATVPQALAEAGRLALEKGGVVCAAGSFFLAGELLGLNQESNTFFR